MEKIRELGKEVPSLTLIYHKWMRNELNGLKLYRGQPHLLFALNNEDGLTHGELSSRMDISAPTLTKMVQRMESNGLLARKQDADDMRISRVFMTEEGRRTFRLMDEHWLKMTEDMFNGFSDEETDVLTGYLQRLRDNIENAIKKKNEGKVGE